MKRISVTLNAVVWTLEQPQGISPKVSASAYGVLWVQFPPMVTNNGATPMQKSGPYRVWYTPLRREGGDLAQSAELILTFPSVVAANDVHVINIVAVGSDHFLLRTNELPLNAQNGGTTRIRWIEPSTHSSKEVVAASEGGGKFLTTAQNDTWLFWNSYEAGTISLYAPHAQAGLIALQDGTSHIISLGEPNVAESAEWEADGKLSFTRRTQLQPMIFDPVINQVQPQS